MRKFLADFISTLSYRGQDRAYSLLEAARLEKSQLDLIAAKLSDQGLFANLQLGREDFGTLANVDHLNVGFHDVTQRLSELYTLSNNIDLLLNSNIDILTADIKALDYELNALEKSTANYSFLLADGGAYDYAYLESFSDTRNREDSFEFMIPDRNGNHFAEGDNATVLAAEGAIALPQTTVNTYPMTGVLLESNCSAFVTSSSNLSNALNSNAGTGWRVSLSTPSPIGSVLPSFANLYSDPRFVFSGVNMVLELYLASPSPCDHIKLSPFSDTKMEIAQIQLFDDVESSNKTNLLSVPVDLDSEKTFYFNLQPLAKVKIFLRQVNYTRTAIEPIVSEARFRRVTNERSQTYDFASKENNARVSFISRLVQNYLLKSRSRKYSISIPRSLHSPNWGTSREELLKIFSSHRKATSRWQNSSLGSNILQEIILSQISADTRDAFFPRLISGGPSNLNHPGVTYDSALGGVNKVWGADPIRHHLAYTQRESFKYEYSVGFQSISVGTSITGLNGVFVSKIIPSPSDVGEVKIKVADENFIESPTERHQPRLTSIEYSVTNQAVPKLEEDWAPILPTGSNAVIGERFLPDQIGKGLFRFPASLEDDIILYKNGFTVNDLDIMDLIIRSRTRQTAVGLSLPLGYATAQDIFVVDYTPAQDVTVVNFEKAGYEMPPLVSSFDEDGAGEGFRGTDGQLLLDLQYEPYINHKKVTAANYIENFGLSGYNPVIVILADGTTALNLTNYKGGVQSVLDAGSDSYSFIQNGRSLMFNRPIEQNFRVYYQYLPNNLRFRVVLRSNSDTYISPKVDFVQVKAKTRKADAKRI